MIAGTPLIIEDLYVIAPNLPELRGKQEFVLAELERMPLVLPHRPHAILNLLRDAGIHPKTVLEADALALMVQLVVESQGYSILPFTAVTRDIEAGRVLAIPIARPSISWTVSLCHVANRPLTPAIRAVAAIVESEVRELIRQGAWPARLAN
jgi:LysR family nitrogen assimilation transcriptional regulator